MLNKANIVRHTAALVTIAFITIAVLKLLKPLHCPEHLL